MRSFYHFLMTYRGSISQTDYSRLAEWAFHDHEFPKHASDFDEISNYIEWNSPFPEALKTFDELWEIYRLNG